MNLAKARVCSGPSAGLQPKGWRTYIISYKISALDDALEHYANIRIMVKHDVPVFNRSFSQVAEEFANVQQRRANAGEVSQARVMNVKNKVNGPLNAYVGNGQIHLVSQDRWSEYPLWRRDEFTLEE